MPVTPPFGAADTHRIAYRQGNRLVADSERPGWATVYASLAEETSRHARLPPLPDCCLAFSVARVATVTRSCDASDDRRERAVLRPHLFSIVPAACASTRTVQGHPRILLVYLRRSLLDHFVLAGCDRDPRGVELIPRLAAHDRLVEQLAQALMSVLVTGAAGIGRPGGEPLRGHAGPGARRPPGP